jgi:hypothetical protein
MAFAFLINGFSWQKSSKQQAKKGKKASKDATPVDDVGFTASYH